MKNKTIIKVPKGVRYIGNWKGFNLPQEPHIMDKTITGCGFTEWCLTNEFNVVLCSPRNILLDNKTEQHEGEVYRIRSEYYDKELGVDKDISNERKKPNPAERVEDPTENEINEETRNLCEKIRTELDEYFLVRNIKPKKILVTYDSFHALKSVLKERGILGAFQIVVDEFQSIFTDARFKSGTELEFVGQLQDIQRVCYLSATPMMGEYLKDIPEFAELPYYELDWEALDPGRIQKPDLDVRVVRSIYDPARRIIEDYKAGRFVTTYRSDENGNPKFHESREVVFYVNSVNNIVQIIKKNNLKPEECNILCAKTLKNDKTIKNKLGIKWEIGRVPLENEPRKMFTFCTRTVYLGADFYSPCAISIILSDANVDCLAVDISLDLPQILGRQRLWENPWKNWARFYYKPLTNSTKNKIPSPEEFDAIINKKLEATEKLLRAFDSAPEDTKGVLANKYLRGVENDNYQDDYVGVNKRGYSNLKPEINNLVIISERRAYDIQQTEYADRFSVISALDIDFSDGIRGEMNAFFTEYDELKTIYDRLKFLCEANLSDEARKVIERQLDDKTTRYLSLGKDRLKALGYHSSKIEKELGDTKTDKIIELKDKIYSEFNEGDRISLSDIKEKLAKIYSEISYSKSAKANDLEEWFEVSLINITSLQGKRGKGFELLKKKGE